jgi:DNA repair exonuclease SbcCD ATPase subunit
VISLTNLDPRLVWDVAQTVVVGAIGVHLFLVDRQRVRRDTLDAMEARLATRIDAVDQDAARTLETHGDRLHAVEAQLEARPAPHECAARLREMTTLTETIRHLPTVQHVKEGDARAHQRIDQVSESLAEIRGTLQRMQGTLDMIAQPLLARLGRE